MHITLHVNLDALRRNYALMRSLAGGAAVAAVVKANAYGAGAIPCARALARDGCRFFYVFSAEEAMALRRALPRYVAVSFLSGPLCASAAEAVFHAGCIPVINNDTQYRLWRDTCRRHGRRAPFSVQFDTGMNRSGFPVADAAGVADRLRQDDMTGGLRYVLTHLACADTPEHTLNAQQVRAFHTVAAWFPRATLSCANSSGIYLGKGFSFHQARAGAALYGMTPNGAIYSRRRPAYVPQPVLHLQSHVRECRVIKEACTAGYGATQQVPSGTRLASIDGGYADGIPYTAGAGRAGCIIHGVYCPTVGRISMDSVIIDVTHCPGPVIPGDAAEWFGATQQAETLARDCDTIAYQLFTAVGNRGIRRYHGGRTHAPSMID